MHHHFKKGFQQCLTWHQERKKEEHFALGQIAFSAQIANLWRPYLKQPQGEQALLTSTVGKSSHPDPQDGPFIEDGQYMLRYQDGSKANQQ